MNKSTFICAALIAGIALAGCGGSPQAREARYLKRGQAFLAKKDFSRALLEFKNAARAMPRDAEPYFQTGLAYLGTRNVRYAAFSFQRALELDPKHNGAQLKLAEMEANSGNHDVLGDAVARLQSIVTSSPDNLEAVNALAIAEFRSGETEGATTLLEETLQKFPKNLGSAISLERMKLREEDFDGAEAVLKKASAEFPRSPLPVLALGQLYVMLNRPEEAEKAFSKTLELDPESGPALLGIAALQLAANRPDQAEQSLQRLASFPDPRYLPVHAIFLYQTGRRDAALSEFEKIAKEHPSDRTARTRLLQAYLQMNKLPEAEALLKETLKKNPKDIDADLQQGKLFFREGKFREAQDDLNQVLHLAPDNIPARRALAAVFGAQGMAHRERQELSEALRLNPSLLETRLQLANNFLAGNDAASALRLLDEASEQQKRTLLWKVERNRALLMSNKTLELRAALDQQLRLVRLPEFVLQNALLKLREHDYSGARDAAEEVLRDNAEDASAARVIADAYFAQKQPNKAVERLRELVAARPNSAPLQDLLGGWELRTGDPAKARAAWTAAKAADPRYLQADVALSELDRRENHPEMAWQRLRAALQSAPSDVPTLMALARLDEYTGNSAEAIATYRTVLSVDADNLFALNNLAWHLALENPEEGLKFAQRAVELAPGNAMVEDTLGWIFYRKGIYSTATTYLKEAFSKDPTPQRQFHLAMSYIKSGDKSLGTKTLEAALRKDPNLFKTEKGW